ncbi:MAG TPA: type II secretion system F family protein [Acidimicrobiales bacterium]|jgi:tight adherence protein B|nr:type II secretion system F family protein [Acidimicrobiales bacterium]
MNAGIFAMIFVGGGLALVVSGVLYRVREREKALAEILDLPFGERDVRPDSLNEGYSHLVEGTIGLAGKVVDQFDEKGDMRAALERARIPMRPGEYVVTAGAATLALAAALYGVTGAWVFAVVGLAVGPLGAATFVRYRIARRRKAFEAALPDALTLIASSLSAGHTFLRAIQMMTEEADPPMSEEFGRLVSETRLGDPVVDALARMAKRLEIRDLDWVVQAIRIQQTVGGRLADLLHTLADFIRAREEVRRDVAVLTAEGRISAWVLTALAPLIFLAINVLSPDYMKPMYQGWGLVVLGGTAALMALGSVIIFRMCKIEV